MITNSISQIYFFFFNNNYGNVVWYQFRGIIATHKNFLKSQEAFKALI